jgi:hypothetical protein
MNVTPSKILLGLSLAAYGYASWDHINPGKSAGAAPPKAAAITAAMVNRGSPLKLERDPFNSVPLGQTLASAAAAAVTLDPTKDLGDLKLNGVMVTLTERAAVINGKTLHEGEVMDTPTGAKIRAKKIGVGYCTVEGAGQLIMLKLDDDKTAPGAGTSAGGPAKQVTGGSGPASPPTPGKPYVAKDKQPQKPGAK